MTTREIEQHGYDGGRLTIVDGVIVRPQGD